MKTTLRVTIVLLTLIVTGSSRVHDGFDGPGTPPMCGPTPCLVG